MFNQVAGHRKFQFLTLTAQEASHSQRIFLSMGNCLIDNHASCMKMCILIILYHSDPAAVP